MPSGRGPGRAVARAKTRIRRAGALLSLGALAAGCGGPGAPETSPRSPTPGDRPAVPASPDGRFTRSIDPFPVHDATGERYAHPFLGGFDVPRPQLVDIDGDGDLDMFLHERTDELVFLENVGSRGAPRFEWRTDRWHDLAVGEWARFADLDGDGDLDLLAERVFSYIRYFENVGSTRRPELRLAADTVRTPAGRAVFSDRQNIPQVADVDCDGVPDLFLGRADGTVSRYELAGWAEGENGLRAPRFEMLAERFEDISIVAQIGGEQVGQAPEAPPAAPSARHGANAMGIADWDGDGDPDLLWGDFFEPSVLLIENTGGCPRFDFRNEPRPVRTVPEDTLLTSGYNVPVPVDWDADGDLDLVVGILGGAFNPNRTAAANLQLWERTGQGERLRLATPRLLHQIDLGSETVPGAGDLDGDGDLDLLVGNKIGPNPGDGSLVFLFENRGTPTAPELWLADTLRLGDNYHYAPVPRDLDGDGLLDLAVGTWNEDVLWYRNVGTAAAPEWERADSALVVLTRGSDAIPAFGDADGDGIDDLFVGESSGELNFYRGTGERRPDGAPAFELVSDEFQDIDPGRRSHPALFDHDGDGDLDLLLGREEPGLVLWLNDGAGAFTRAGEMLRELPPYGAPLFADLDGDGLTDVVSGGLSGGLVWLGGR